MGDYIIPIVVLMAIGAVSGVLLTIAAKILSVKTDETVEKILEVLPGANCGACGFSGCEGYANAVASGKAGTSMCKPGGNDVAIRVSGIMGVTAQTSEREVAFVRCNGNCGATEEKFAYIGTQSCNAVEKFYNGKGKCQAQCHGYGDCISVCGEHAISIENGVAVVNAAKCKACGKCVKTCPNHLITMRKISQQVIVRCSTPNVGKITKANCKNGCIGCKICEKKCPNEAIHVVNNHAEVIPEKCTGCGICAQACPIKCISVLPVCDA